MSESLVIRVREVSRAECLRVARLIALDAFTVEGEVQPFTEVNVQLEQSAQAGLEDERFWAGSVTYVSNPSPPFGFSTPAPVEVPEQTVHLPGVDTGGLTVGGAPIDKLDEVPVVDPPIEMGKM